MAEDQKKFIEYKPQYCPLCGARFMNLLGAPLANHRQLSCSTTDGNSIDLGVCVDCVDRGVTQDEVNAILEGIKLYWCQDIEDDKTKTREEKDELIDFHNSHEIESVDEVVETSRLAEEEAREKGELL